MQLCSTTDAFNFMMGSLQEATNGGTCSAHIYTHLSDLVQLQLVLSYPFSLCPARCNHFAGFPHNHFGDVHRTPSRGRPSGVGGISRAIRSAGDLRTSYGREQERCTGRIAVCLFAVWMCFHSPHSFNTCHSGG